MTISNRGWSPRKQNQADLFNASQIAAKLRALAEFTGRMPALPEAEKALGRAWLMAELASVLVAVRGGK